MDQPTDVPIKKRHYCGECGVAFSSDYSLRRHQSTHRTNRKRPHACDLCRASFTRRDHLEAHRAIHTDAASGKCDSCGVVFLTKYKLKMHQRTHTHGGMSESLHTCEVCHLTFTRRDNLKRHRVDQHAAELGDGGKHRGGASSKGGNTLQSERDLRALQRKRASSKFPCDVCRKVFSKRFSLKRHQNSHRAATPQAYYICDICSGSFSRKDSLKRHKLLHTYSDDASAETNGEAEGTTDGRPAGAPRKRNVRRKNTIHLLKECKCDFCDRVFQTNFQLLMHKRVHLPRKRVYVCETCGKTFTMKNHYAQHVASHTAKGPYICSVCQRVCPTKGQLNRHRIAVHTKEQRYICDVCGKGFFPKSRLKVHQASTHSDVKPHLCDICGRAFSLKYQLNKHTAIHSEKTCLCSTCGKPFATTDALHQHKKSHTGVRPHVCSLCGDAFILKHHLKNHMGAHSNERPFECVICSKAFLLKHQLKNHQKTHVSEETKDCQESETAKV